MAKAFNMIQESISSGGTGDVTLGGAVTGFKTFASRLSDGEEVYVMFSLGEGNFNGDANDWEVSACTYNSAGGTITRNTVQESTNSDAAITVSTSHTASIVNPAFTVGKTQFENPIAGVTRVGQDAGNETMSGVDTTLIGHGAGASLTTGQENTFVGTDAGDVCTTGTLNTYIGKDAGKGATSSNNTAVGKDAYGGTTTHTGAGNTIMGRFAGDELSSGDSNCLMGDQNRGASGGGRRNSIIGAETTSASGADYTYGLGYRLGNNNNSCLLLGYRITSTATRQAVFGNAAYPTEGEITDFYFNGITHSSGTAPTIQACGGSGTNNVAKALNVAGGKSTGNAAGGALNFQTSDAGASGTALQSLSTKGYVDGTDGGLVWGSPTGGSQGAGTINAQGVYDDGVLLTDYIFEIAYDGSPIDERWQGYEIKPLSDEIEFVKKNKHLSTIIGREEWEKGGSSLGQLVNQLWATIETQHLYIAELSDRLEKLENDS
jgi:hypothetical protein